MTNLPKSPRFLLAVYHPEDRKWTVEGYGYSDDEDLERQIEIARKRNGDLNVEVFISRDSFYSEQAKSDVRSMLKRLWK